MADFTLCSPCKSWCSLWLDYLKLINHNGHKEGLPTLPRRRAGGQVGAKDAMKYVHNKNIAHSIKFVVEPIKLIIITSR